MKNEELWQPSKFVQTKNGLRASRDRKQVGLTSRHSADQTAIALEPVLKKYCRGNLLDLGAGKAPLYSVYRPLVDGITCVDWAESLHGNSYLDHTFDLNKGIPLESDSFDSIISTSVFEHIWQPAVLWSDVNRVLKPGGHFVLQVPFMFGLHEMPHDYFRYTRFALESFGKSSGMETVEILATGGIRDVLTLMLSKATIYQPPNKVSRLLTRVVSRSLSYLSIDNLKSADTFPLGYIFVGRKPIILSKKVGGE